MTGGRVDRRTFLAFGGAALVAAALAACGGSSPGPAADLGPLPTIFADRAALQKVGRHAVRAPGVAARPRELAAALAPDGSAAWLGRASAASVSARLRSSIAADFERGRVVDVAGWQLAITEARVAALIFVSR